jgi:hypothetical protein
MGLRFSYPLKYFDVSNLYGRFLIRYEEIAYQEQLDRKST